VGHIGEGLVPSSLGSRDEKWVIPSWDKAPSGIQLLPRLGIGAAQLEKTLALLLAATKQPCPPPRREHSSAEPGRRCDHCSQCKHFISFRRGWRRVYGDFLFFFF